VQEVSKIIEITSEFELDIYVTEQWLDPSLDYSHMNPCKMNLSLNGEELGFYKCKNNLKLFPLCLCRILPQIWSPRAVFVNSKSASVHFSPVKNVFLMIYSNGTVWVNYRIKLTGELILISRVH